MRESGGGVHLAVVMGEGGVDVRGGVTLPRPWKLTPHVRYCPILFPRPSRPSCDSRRRIMARGEHPGERTAEGKNVPRIGPLPFPMLCHYRPHNNNPECSSSVDISSESPLCARIPPAVVGSLYRHDPNIEPLLSTGASQQGSKGLVTMKDLSAMVERAVPAPGPQRYRHFGLQRYCSPCVPV